MLKSGSLDTEYAELVALQSETFSYLTTTGITLSGPTIGAPETNMLITAFSTPVEYEIPLDEAGDTSAVYYVFSLVIENRRIAAMDTII